MSNLLRFYYNEFQKASRVFEEGNLDLAEAACCQLIEAYQCPPLIQVQAHQLRSRCTRSYWLAASRLQSAASLIASFNNDEDELVMKARKHTKHWKRQGLEPPRTKNEHIKRSGLDKSFHSASEGSHMSPGTSSGDSSIETVVEQAEKDRAGLDLGSLSQLERLRPSAHFGAGRFATPETVSGEKEVVEEEEESARRGSQHAYEPVGDDGARVH
ncbi:hypothetical protein LTR56_013629 [Elasticomyces elasticus]|nr:hypothetical protein LTR22_018441 [Elasticomyces elasticus]KAK3637456.1 hypothetical protein LTR56_013629 [Elasticomyces elasticus]KAK4917885.1 hypothetical protein LTR49_014289 [Elasticomyces elasticus]KAK5757044.1 hypothetical protein LTS12_012858 [Elasticomyces elasticus]